jgi:hypothetical protein
LIGFYEEIVSKIPAGGVPFWVLGALSLVPALYYTIEVIRVWRARTPSERQQILQDFVNYD